MQDSPLGLQPDHDTFVEGAVGVAVKVSGVPVTNAALQEPGQVIPDGVLVTVPVPLVMLTVKRGELPPPPVSDTYNHRDEIAEANLREVVFTSGKETVNRSIHRS